MLYVLRLKKSLTLLPARNVRLLNIVTILSFFLRNLANLKKNNFLTRCCGFFYIFTSRSLTSRKIPCFLWYFLFLKAKYYLIYILCMYLISTYFFDK
ncbi:MAG: hypothetical protein [Microviridae sp.]|nr:MAG: hypothetical protein [Microviridae sp.]